MLCIIFAEIFYTGDSLVFQLFCSYFLKHTNKLLKKFGFRYESCIFAARKNKLLINNIKK